MHKPINQRENSIANAVVNKINKYLGEKNITLYELHLRSGVSYSTLKSIMSGRTKDIKFSTILLITYGFDIKLDEFINSSDFSAEKFLI